MVLKLPINLINSLTELGLLDSEAKIYVALVLLQNAEVRDLLELLDLSKPRIYDSLRMLEESGLIVLTSPRPTTYQAIEPKIALETIIKKQEDAKEEALKEFQTLKNKEIIPKPSPPLWFIFGAKSLEFKIKDMIKNAKETIYCQTSEKYLKYIEKASKKELEINLVVMVNGQEIKKRLEKLSKKSNVEINIIEKKRIMETSDVINHEKELYKRINMHLEDIVDLDNEFKLVVDDSELLTIPPLKSDSLNAITSTNKALIIGTKMDIEEALSSYKSNK